MLVLLVIESSKAEAELDDCFSASLGSSRISMLQRIILLNEMND